MEKQIIWRGLLAGAAAGVLSFIFSRVPPPDMTMAARADSRDSRAPCR